MHTYTLDIDVTHLQKNPGYGPVPECKIITVTILITSLLFFPPSVLPSPFLPLPLSPSHRLVVSELQAMLNAVGGPSNIQPQDPSNPYPGLTNFSLLTHGFGNPTINTSLGVLQTYLQELLMFYEGRKPIQPDSRYVFNEKHAHPPPPPPSLHNPMMVYVDNQSVQGSDISGNPTNDMALKKEPSDSPNSCAL